MTTSSSEGMGTSHGSPILIRQQRRLKAEQDLVGRFIAEIYHASSITDGFLPTEDVPEMVFTAWAVNPSGEEELIGTIGTVLGKNGDGKRLPTEEHFDFGFRTIFHVDKDAVLQSQIAEVTRLTIKLEHRRNIHLLEGLLTAVSLWAIDRGIRFLIATIKLGLRKRLIEAMGFEPNRIDGKTPVSEKIPAIFHPYFFPKRSSARAEAIAIWMSVTEKTPLIQAKLSCIQNNSVVIRWEEGKILFFNLTTRIDIPNGHANENGKGSA